MRDRLICSTYMRRKFVVVDALIVSSVLLIVACRLSENGGMEGERREEREKRERKGLWQAEQLARSLKNK